MSKEYYIYLNDELLPVSKEVWEVYYRGRSKEYYMRKVYKKRTISSESVEFMDYLFNKNDKVEKSAEDIAINNILVEQVVCHMKSLPPLDQQLLFDIYYEQLSERKVAEKLNICQQSVSYRKNRIIRTLRKKLKVV